MLAAGLISFVFLKPTCRWLTKKGWAKQPFTAQENTVSQTFAMAMTGSSAPFASISRCGYFMLHLHFMHACIIIASAHNSSWSSCIAFCLSLFAWPWDSSCAWYSILILFLLLRAVWCLGFGSYLEGLTTIGYNLTGGDSTPGNVGIYDANSAKSIIGYGLCIIFIGVLQHRFQGKLLRAHQCKGSVHISPAIPRANVWSIA